MDSESSDIFKIGDWVICTAPGPFFGKVGEILEPANAAAQEHGIDWWVLFNANEGAGFCDNELMGDPRDHTPLTERNDNRADG